MINSMMKLNTQISWKESHQISINLGYLDTVRDIVWDIE